jgi:hypothetical protein
LLLLLELSPNYLSNEHDINKNQDKKLYFWIDPSQNLSTSEKKSTINKMNGAKLKEHNLMEMIKSINSYKGNKKITQLFVSKRSGFSIASVKRNWEILKENITSKKI